MRSNFARQFQAVSAQRFCSWFLSNFQRVLNPVSQSIYAVRQIFARELPVVCSEFALRSHFICLAFALCLPCNFNGFKETRLAEWRSLKKWCTIFHCCPSSSMVEQRPFKSWVQGSSPWGGTFCCGEFVVPVIHFCDLC